MRSALYVRVSTQRQAQPQTIEQQIERLRTHLLSEHAQAGFHQERPVCPQCGASMLPRARSTRTLLLRGDQSLELERSYVVCPSCGEGLFPPG